MGILGLIKMVIEMVFVLFIVACLSTLFLGSPGAVFSKVFAWISNGFK
jgi:hypothetical protein